MHASMWSIRLTRDYVCLCCRQCLFMLWSVSQTETVSLWTGGTGPIHMAPPCCGNRLTAAASCCIWLRGLVEGTWVGKGCFSSQCYRSKFYIKLLGYRLVHSCQKMSQSTILCFVQPIVFAGAYSQEIRHRIVTTITGEMVAGHGVLIVPPPTSLQFYDEMSYNVVFHIKYQNIKCLRMKHRRNYATTWPLQVRNYGLCMASPLH